jgi:hypothetical protein
MLSDLDQDLMSTPRHTFLKQQCPSAEKLR